MKTTTLIELAPEDLKNLITEAVKDSAITQTEDTNDILITCLPRLTAKQAAVIIGVKTQTVRKYIREGRLQRVETGAEALSTREVLRFAARRKQLKGDFLPD